MGWLLQVPIPSRVQSFSSANIVKPANGPTHPPIQWVEQVISLCIKQPGHEAEESLASSAEVNNKCSCTCAPSLFMAWTSLLYPSMLDCPHFLFST